MHPQQLKKKALRSISSSIPDRMSTRSNSYLKTCIRGSRLRNAARLLALVELSRRLHQAYRFAYDKQAADQLLPQNPGQDFNHPRTPYVDQKVLAACVQDYFNWQLLEFKPSTRGGLGSFRGIGTSYHPSNPNPGNNQELTITNNAPSYSISYLKYKSAELGSPTPPKYDVYGLSVGNNLTNWTGNDVPTAMDILMTQVHELGHTLDALTHIGYDDETRHPKRPDLGGKILENCVKSRGGFKYSN